MSRAQALFLIRVVLKALIGHNVHVRRLEAMLSEDRDPTPGEWAALEADLQAASDRLERRS